MKKKKKLPKIDEKLFYSLWNEYFEGLLNMTRVEEHKNLVANEEIIFNKWKAGMEHLYDISSICED